MSVAGRWIAVLSVVALCTGPTPTAAQDLRARRDAPVPAPPVDDWSAAPVDEWLSVLESHAPGVADSALMTAAQWSLDDLRATWVGAVVSLTAATSTKRNRFDVDPLDLAARPRPDARIRINLSRAERRELERLVARLTTLGVDRALMRAVVVHTDLVTMMPGIVRTSSAPLVRGAPLRMNAGDGRAAGMEGLSVHWDMARLLLQLTPSSAAADRFACDWFRATVALGQRGEFFDANHLRQGLRRCPDDAVLRFLAGAEREALASPFFQAFARSLGTSVLRPEIDDAGQELEAAERWYRRALEVAPTLSEARVRLAKVLIDRGRAAAAVGELERSLADALEPVVEYLAALFLGSALEATGRPAEAAVAYRRAAALTPGARLPQLALARIALTLGDIDAMTASLDQALQPVPDGAPTDPWWAYRGVQARHADRWLTAVRRLAAGSTP